MFDIQKSTYKWKVQSRQCNLWRSPHELTFSPNYCFPEHSLSLSLYNIRHAVSKSKQVSLEPPKDLFTENVTIFRKVDVNASVPLPPLTSWSSPSQVWPLSCFHPLFKMKKKEKKKSLYPLRERNFSAPPSFLLNLLWHGIVADNFHFFTVSAPSIQPTFHPLVLKSWILSGPDLTYSFPFPCTSITSLKSRKGRDLVWSRTTTTTWRKGCAAKAGSPHLEVQFPRRSLGNDVIITHNAHIEVTVTMYIVCRKRLPPMLTKEPKQRRVEIFGNCCVVDMTATNYF